MHRISFSIWGRSRLAWGLVDIPPRPYVSLLTALHIDGQSKRPVRYNVDQDDRQEEVPTACDDGLRHLPIAAAPCKELDLGSERLAGPRWRVEGSLGRHIVDHLIAKADVGFLPLLSPRLLSHNG